MPGAKGGWKLLLTGILILCRLMLSKGARIQVRMNGSHLALSIVENKFRAKGTLEITIDGVAYRQPANETRSDSRESRSLANDKYCRSLEDLWMSTALVYV